MVHKLQNLTLFAALIAMLTGVAVAQEVESRHSIGKNTAIVYDCIIKPAKDLEISASEAGQLVLLVVEEGSRVKEKQPIGRVDDEEARMQRKAAKHGMDAAEFQKDDVINIEYSDKVYEVAQKELEIMEELNVKSPRSVSFVEMEKLRLEADRAGLGRKKAVNDRKLAEFEFFTKKIEFDAAGMGIKRRIVRAPSNGEVVELFHQQGEWVNPGDPILRLVQLDKLHVEGKLSASDYEPSELLGCKVTVQLTTGSRTVEAPGRIVWVNPVAEWFTDGEYRWKVRAEVANKLVNGNWNLHPGPWGEMVIHLGTAKDVRVSRRGK